MNRQHRAGESLRRLIQEKYISLLSVLVFGIGDQKRCCLFFYIYKLIPLKKIVRLLSLCAFLGMLPSCISETQEKKTEDGTLIQLNPNKRNDDWGFIGPGGGGAMFNPAINPSNPDHAFVSCDMTGSFVTYDGGEHWRMFNLRGVVRFYTFDPFDSDVVYAGTDKILFKSMDQGTSWHAIYPRPEDILGISSQGDHANEVVVTKDSTINTIKKMVLDPDKPQKLYLLIESNENKSWPIKRGEKVKQFTSLLVSRDNGLHWQEDQKFETEFDNIFIDPFSDSDNRTIYLSGKENIQVRKSRVWSGIIPPRNAGTITQYADGVDVKNNRHIIFALTGRSYFNGTGDDKKSGIYKSIDGGRNWINVGEALKAKKSDGAPDPEFRSMAVCYYQPNNIYVSYANFHTSNDTVSIGVAKSVDTGQTWQLVWNDKSIKGKSMVSPNRTSGWLDERFGPSWGENPFHMKIADNDPNTCYATDFGRTLKTTDGGSSWQQVYTNKNSNGGWSSRGLQVTTGYMLAFDPFDSLHCFLADTDTGLMESHDGGKSWTSATENNGVPRSWVNSTYWMVFDPEVKGKVWAVMSGNHDLPRPKMWRSKKMESYTGGVLVSDNGGATWQATSKDIGEAATTFILMDPKSDAESRTLYVCAFGKGVYKSTDGGLTWELKNKGIEGKEPAAWRITRNDNGDLYLIVFRKSEDGSIGTDRDGALYRSTDGAESWTKISLPNNVNGPSSLLVRSNRMILSAWGRVGESKFSNDQGGGIYLSEDRGESWISVLTRDQHIHDVTSDPKSDVLYAAGFNSSAYRSEDQGRNWQRIKGYNFKWGKRVQVDPYDSEKIYIITFGGGVWHGPAKGDENALEDIVTSEVAYY